ncbi:MAG: hypothetical protein J6W41_01270 [Alphaproteobacteria bacterium]|nr:hypothetical protein [Alphaproteobacteria bacterium]
MTDVKIYVQRMYVGFVYVHWAERKNIKLGTAKQKSIQQIKSFSNTLDKSNPIAGEIKSNVQQMSRDVARQIMTDKSSEMTLDAGKLPQYRAFGERQVAAAKSALGVQMARGNVAQANAGQNNAVQKSHTTKRHTISQVRDTQNKSRTQDMLAKQNAPQYRAHKTNVPAQGAKPATTLQKLDQKKLLQMFAYNKYQKAA